MISFIDQHRDRFGGEPICRVLTEHGCKIAPSGYHAFKKRPASAPAVRDAHLVVVIEKYSSISTRAAAFPESGRSGDC